ncbi:TPA: YfgM family protein [Pasteurella multocida]|nr:YfgM family protein [Pasteurella multocida]
MAYTAEEEQELNEIKAWWKENYKTLIASIIIAFGGMFGWNYWQSHQVNKIQQTSAQYEQALYSTADFASKSVQIEQFVQANSKTSYAVLALLEKAKVEVEKKEFAQAEQSLKQALAQSTDENLSSITALRLASVQFQQQAFDMALDSLKQVKESSWDSRKNLLIGDILLAKGDKVAAKASYQQALNHASPLEAQWLQVRLNNL